MGPVFGDDLDNGAPKVFEHVADACLRGKRVARAVHTSTICGSRKTMWFPDKIRVVLLEGRGSKKLLNGTSLQIHTLEQARRRDTLHVQDNDKPVFWLVALARGLA